MTLNTSSLLPASGKIPVLLLAGFLGAGKTTFLNHVLTEKHGEKIAVIVNEFGQIGVDQKLIIGEKERVVEMSNGCICCSVRTDLVETLLKLSNESGKAIPRFERVIIETTGLADPVPLIQTFLADPRVAQRYELEAVVVLVDAKNIRHQRKYLPLADEQIACADILILNKIDLVSPNELVDIRNQVVAINPFALIFEGREGRVPLQELWGKRFFNATNFTSTRRVGDVHDTHDHLLNISTILLEHDQPVSLPQFEEWLGWVLEHSGPDMLRYKGFVWIEESKEFRMLLQGVHREYQITDAGIWEKSSPQRTQLIFIGRDLAKEWLVQSWKEFCHSAGAHRHE